MGRKILVGILGGLILLTTGCASLMGGPSKKDKMFSWLGRSSSELASVNGVPSNTVSLPNGGAVWSYYYASNYGEQLRPVRELTVNQLNQCTDTYTISASGVVEYVRWSGMCGY